MAIKGAGGEESISVYPTHMGVSPLGRLQGRQGGCPLLSLLRALVPLHVLIPNHGGTQDTLGLHESSSDGDK